MNPAEKNHMLHLLASLLQDNAGNRLTLSLVNGIVTTLDGMLPVHQAPQPQADLPAGDARPSPLQSDQGVNP